LLVEAGFSPEQSIQIMTLNGAKILHEDAARGSIAVGKVADLVAVRGNPIAAPGDIYNVVTVFKDGIGYDSEKLRNAAKGKVGVN
jgi:imidazolonepropionase-like amidohydrolase